jgi:hypothetical protein
MEGDFESRAWKFLHELYSLAHGNPKSVVVGREAAKRASIPHTTKDYHLIARRLMDSGLIEECGTIGLQIFRITPRGVRVVNEGEPLLFLT